MVLLHTHTLSDVVRLLRFVALIILLTVAIVHQAVSIDGPFCQSVPILVLVLVIVVIVYLGE